jgi:molybdopterin-guanine dinucleotide biosynthesis protein A
MSTLPSARRRCAAAILAGGRAIRLDGADKSALVVGGRTIRDRQLAALDGVAGEVFVVGGAPAPVPTGLTTPPPTTQPTTQTTILPRIADREPDRGPLGGLQAALHHAAAAPVVLIVACDLPFLSRPFLAFLLARALDADGSADVVVPRSGDRLHPLCATYNRRVREVVDRRVASGALAVQALFDEVRVDVVEPEVVATFDPEGVMFWNVNTPDEYERACARAAMA